MCTYLSNICVLIRSEPIDYPINLMQPSVMSFGEISPHNKRKLDFGPVKFHNSQDSDRYT